MTMASRIAVMDQGRIRQVAPPAEIYEAPNSEYVAGFIGEVSFLRGQAAAGPDGTVAVAWAEGEAPAVALGSAPAGQEVTLALRPEKVRIATEPPPGPNAYQGRVEDMAYLGNITSYHVRLAGGQVLTAQTANTRRSTTTGITWEDTVWVSFDPEEAVVLPQ